MPAITQYQALEILDLRENPTVEVAVGPEDGTVGRAVVPSGDQGNHLHFHGVEWVEVVRRLSHRPQMARHQLPPFPLTCSENHINYLLMKNWRALLGCFALIVGIISVLALSGPAAFAMTVSSDLSATSLRVTDTLLLRVSASWEGGENLYRFATLHPVENSLLRLTSQTVGGSQRLENGVFLSEKTWHFSFLCVQPGSTQVVPPVVAYTNTETGATDSTAASPMLLTIGPPPAPPFNYRRLWLYGLGLIVVAGGAYAGAVILRRRRQAAEQRKLHKTPEEEAIELLETLRPLKREDKCQQFYSDLERIILGLWEARGGKRLAGKTPTEVAEILRGAGIPEEESARVQEALTQCHHVRFGGGIVAYDVMDKSFHAVYGWVKPSEGP